MSIDTKIQRLAERQTSMRESAFRDAPAEFTANPIWQRFNAAGQAPMVKVPSDVIMDIDNQLGGFGSSSAAPVNGVYTIAPGATLTLTVGGQGYRPAIFRRLCLDSQSPDLAECTVQFQAASTGKNYQIGNAGLVSFPARLFGPGSFTSPELHVAVNSTVSTSVAITNGSANPVRLTAGVVIC